MDRCKEEIWKLESSKFRSESKARQEEDALIVKTTYSECPSYDAMIPVVMEHGVKKLPEYCKIQPGVPMKPMLAHPTKGISEVLKRFDTNSFTCEYKYDGERAQVGCVAWE